MIAATGYNTITTAQAQRFYTIASNNQWSKEGVKEVVYRLFPDRFEDVEVSVRQLLTDEYEAICIMMDHVREHEFTQRDFDKLKACIAQKHLDELEIRTENPALNPDQSRALQAILEWWNRVPESHNGVAENDRWFLLDGLAGSGKTYTAWYAIQEILKVSPSTRICLSSAWNDPLENLVGSIPESFDHMTLYRGLGLSIDHDDEGKNKVVKNQGKLAYGGIEDLPLDFYDLVVIDEVGVIDSELNNALDSVSSNVRFLCLGDIYQLPPVGNTNDGEKLTESPIFSRFISENTAQLRIIERYDSASQLGGAVRYAVDSLIECDSFSPSQLKDYASINGSSSLQYVPRTRWLTELLAAVENPKEYNPETDAIISYTNANVDSLNNAVRRTMIEANRILGLSPGSDAEYSVGEVMTINKPITIDGLNLYRTGEKDQIIGCDLGSMTVNRVHLLVWKLRLSRFPAVTLTRIHRDCLELFEEQAEALAGEAREKRQKHLWSRYFAFVSTHCPMSYSYAGTVHKAQGKSKDRVWINGSSLASCKDPEMKTKLWYVALSRAKKQAIFCL